MPTYSYCTTNCYLSMYVTDIVWILNIVFTHVFILTLAFDKENDALLLIYRFPITCNLNRNVKYCTYDQGCLEKHCYVQTASAGKWHIHQNVFVRISFHSLKCREACAWFSRIHLYYTDLLIRLLSLGCCCQTCQFVDMIDLLSLITPCMCLRYRITFFCYIYTHVAVVCEVLNVHTCPLLPYYIW